MFSQTMKLKVLLVLLVFMTVIVAGVQLMERSMALQVTCTTSGHCNSPTLPEKK